MSSFSFFKNNNLIPIIVIVIIVMSGFGVSYGQFKFSHPVNQIDFEKIQVITNNQMNLKFNKG
jgi:hypothetical protein